MTYDSVGDDRGSERGSLARTNAVEASRIRRHDDGGGTELQLLNESDTVSLRESTASV